MKAENKYFLPYQINWLKDESKIKIWEKSRRIGATYVQAYEDVRDCISGKVPSVWFSSADESAAKEYILYCSMWAKLFDKGAKDLGELVIESDKSIKTFTIEFSNGKRINALSSNPKAFRSKGGKVVLDEFAFHTDAKALWKAAKPVITWGFPLRILSTHHGQQSLYFKFIDQIKKGKLNWSLHTTTIYDAVNDGIVDKILSKKATVQEKENWVKSLEEDSFDKTTWLEEYCCIPVDEATAFLSYDLITGCEDNCLLGNEDFQNDFYVGVDIGRRKDLTVIWVVELIGNRFFTRIVKELEKTPFKIQKEILYDILQHPKFRRCCIDSTGIGMQLAEETQTDFGKFRVEPIMFTGRTKEELAFNLYTNFEDKNVVIPSMHNIREDLHSIRKVTSASNNIRFDVAQSEVSGHADRFWALALALYAGKNSTNSDIIIDTLKNSYSNTLLRGY
jgi:phage FluMu gp28-like protein